MADDTKKRGETEAKVRWNPETIEEAIRARVRHTIEVVLEQELEAALGAGPSVRVGDQRRGYRHGSHERVLTTSVGPTPVAVPRARLEGDGHEGMAESDPAALSAADGAGRRSDSRRLSGWWQQPADPRGIGAVAEGRPALQGCGL